MIVKPITWEQAIDAAEVELQAGAIADARLNAELLAAHTLGLWTRREVRDRSKQHLTQQDLDHYQSLIRRRLQHEPLQYITGETEFFGLRLYCSPAALIPRPDTEILVEEALKAIGKRSGAVRVLDIGTGTGCIALAIASRYPEAEIVGIDISDEALALAEKNSKRLGFENVRFVKADMRSKDNMSDLGIFDIIISNPPYIPLPEYESLDPEVHDFEPRSALTDEGEGLAFYKAIFAMIPGLLARDGALLVEIGFGARGQILNLSHSMQLTGTVSDLAGVERALIFIPEDQ